MTDLRIYVACLAAYNSGQLHGDWIDVTQGIEHIEGEIQRILASSPAPNAEEWAVHDYDMDGYDAGEHPDLDELFAIAELMQEDSDKYYRCKELIAYGVVDTLDKAIEYDDDNYCGYYESWADYAEQFCNDTGEIDNIPNNFRYYIDWEAYGRDLEIEMLGIEEGRGVHVYHNA